MAKAAVMQLASSIAAEGSGLYPSQHVVTLLPVTLDTKGNRQAMPGADTSSWTPLETIAKKVLDWVTEKEDVKRGALVHVKTEHNSTEFIVLDK